MSALNILKTVMEASTGVEASLALVLANINKAALGRAKELGSSSQPILPQLLAVSKTKPVSLIKHVYDCGQRHFGENYVKELVEKAEQFQNDNVKDINWHFIGHLQRNKASLLCSAANLHTVHTVDSTKLADALDKAWAKQQLDRRLNIMVQVNTSGEDSKSGCSPSDCAVIIRHVLDSCPRLHFSGLMTIGAPNHDYSEGPNPDFVCLAECKQRVVTELELDEDCVRLSMGMSNDYEEAITAGADCVRVGSLIFGARNYNMGR